MIGILLLIVGLTLINGFFAAAEMALVSINPSQLHQLVKQDVPHAKKLEMITKDSTKYLSTIQVAITFAGFLSSAFAGATLSERFINWLETFNIYISEQLMVVIITVLLSYFTLVFGELVPKRIALAKSTSFALFSAPIVNVVMKIFKPFVALLSLSTQGVLKIIGIKHSNNEDKITEKDVKEMIVYGHIKGLYPPEETQMLERIFKLDDLTAGMIMTPIHEVKHLILEHIAQHDLDELIDSKFSRFPVFQNNDLDILGVILLKDILLKKEDLDLSVDKLSTFIIKPLIFNEHVKIDVILSQMKSLSIHMAFVTDEHGDTLGIVTMEDIIEEIVGNIYDEHDNKVIKNTYKQSLTYIINGKMTMSDLSYKLNIIIDPDAHEDMLVVDYVKDKLGYLPKKGKVDRLEFEYGYFDVLSVDHKKIKTLRLVLTQ